MKAARDIYNIKIRELMKMQINFDQWSYHMVRSVFDAFFHRIVKYIFILHLIRGNPNITKISYSQTVSQINTNSLGVINLVRTQSFPKN